MPRYGPDTALIVVDVQNDFGDPAGGLYVRGGEEVVPVLNEEIAAATEAGAAVLYTQDWHPASTPHFAKDGGVWPVHCVQESWGAELHPGLSVVGPVVRKGSHGEDGYSGFTMRDPTTGATVPTDLEASLRARDVRRVVVAGLATDYCVKETVLDALRLAFPTLVLSAAIRAVDLADGDGARAIEAMVGAGATLEA